MLSVCLRFLFTVGNDFKTVKYVKHTLMRKIQSGFYSRNDVLCVLGYLFSPVVAGINFTVCLNVEEYHTHDAQKRLLRIALTKAYDLLR